MWSEDEDKRSLRQLQRVLEDREGMAGSRGLCLAVLEGGNVAIMPCGCGSKIGTPDGTLVSGNMDQNLRSPGGLILTHTRVRARSGRASLSAKRLGILRSMRGT